MIRQHGELRDDRFAELDRLLATEQAKPHPARSYTARLDIYPGHSADMTAAAARMIEHVAAWFGVPAEAVRGHKRTAVATRARHVAMYVVRRSVPGASLHVVGRMFAGHEHTTVLHACRRVERDRALVPSLDEFLRGLGL